MIRDQNNHKETHKTFRPFIDSDEDWNAWTHVFRNPLHRKIPRMCSSLLYWIISKVQSEYNEKYSWSSLSIFLNQETTIFERKSITVSLHYCREDLLFLWCIFVAPIHETIFFPRMAVEITVKNKVSFIFHPFYHLLGVVYCWMGFFDWINPLPIQIYQA